MTSEHWTFSIIRELSGSGFYGSLTLQFKEGVVVIARKEETILPPPEEYVLANT